MLPWHIMWFHRLYHRFDSRTIYIGRVIGCIDIRVTWILLQGGHGDLFDHFGHIISPYKDIHIQLTDGTVISLFSIQVSSLYTFFYLQGCASSSYLELDMLDHCGTFAVGFLAKNRIG